MNKILMLIVLAGFPVGASAVASAQDVAICDEGAEVVTLADAIVASPVTTPETTVAAGINSAGADVDPVAASKIQVCMAAGQVALLGHGSDIAKIGFFAGFSMGSSANFSVGFFRYDDQRRPIYHVDVDAGTNLQAYMAGIAYHKHFNIGRATGRHFSYGAKVGTITDRIGDPLSPLLGVAVGAGSYKYLNAQLTLGPNVYYDMKRKTWGAYPDVLIAIRISPDQIARWLGRKIGR